MRLRSLRIALVAVVLIAAVAGGVPALLYQQREAAKTLCLSNERRLATALLLYAQDHDERMPPPDYRLPDGVWRNWLGIIQPYVSNEDIAVCPANPTAGAFEPRHGYRYPYGYALNERFFGVFGPGPFPIDNLEMSAQTVLLAEGGAWQGSAPPARTDGRWAVSIYTDASIWPQAYHSPHSGRMNVAAADGHVTTLKLAHYAPAGHDTLYGRLGGSVYNWNGGHPNGDTGGAPRE